ncbi:hypothetical protein [Luteimonas salinilitoris]|uniref:TonB-dependent receptor n=1 Tax=Luteimonas salinilitoris TaxID=3237697 RepID=A0ABV4HN28_9GAMM
MRLDESSWSADGAAATRTSAQWRLRVYNATDRHAWSAGSSGLQSWEPARRVMLSLTLGE